MSFKDKTYCASPNCINECGRKMNPEERRELNLLEDAGYYERYVSYAYFCDEPELENEQRKR